jgi:uncharacterized protein (DUF1810 family)
MSDPFDLQRFVDARAPVYPASSRRTAPGSKAKPLDVVHFSQFAGLGHSAMAQRFAIGSRDEALAYLDHGVLGPRLRECTALVTAVEGRITREILGSPTTLNSARR